MKKSRIVIVEDEGITLEYIKHTINTLGCEAIGDAITGKEAIEKAARLQPDLVLMDIHLKGKMDGIEAASYIQDKLNIPVIYLTAYSDDKTLQRAKFTNPYGYLLKPLNTSELKIAIEIVLFKHQIRKQLIESEKKYRSIFENSLDSIFVLSEDGKFEDINEAGLEFFGYPKKELNSFFSERLFSNPLEIKTLKAILKEQAFVKGYEIHITRKNGKPSIGLLSAVVIKDEKGKNAGFQGIIKDITKEKTMEAQLLQASKMESIGRLAGGIAHDFNNLLTIINGYTEALIMRVKVEKIKNELNIIAKAGEKAAHLVSQILAYSRKQPIQPIKLNINENIKELEKMFKRILRENITLKIKLAPTIQPIYIDSSQFEQIVMNLIINARDAMPLGGTLTIETKNSYIDYNMVNSHPFLKTGDFVELIISDTGIGMDHTTLENIFEPFFTTKPENQGTGLGLATVYGIIKQNNGFILVSSKPRQGTTFMVYFPIYTPLKKLSQDTNSKEKASFPPLSVLIVEDEWGLRKLLEGIFQSLGFKTLKAENGTEAVKVAKHCPGKIDLLFTDIIMPGIPVPKMIENIKERYPYIKVLYSSGYPGEIFEKVGLESNQKHFLKKPFTKKVLIEKLNMILKEESDEKRKNSDRRG